MKGFIFLIGVLSVSIKNIVEDYVFSLRVLHVCLCVVDYTFYSMTPRGASVRLCWVDNAVGCSFHC